MFDISWTEFLLIGVVALIVIGPKELPAVMRTMGQWTRKVRSMAADFQGQFQEAMREAEMADLKKQVDDIAQDIKNYDPLKDVRADVEAAGRDIQSSLQQPLMTSTTADDAAPQPTAALPIAEAAAELGETDVVAAATGPVAPEAVENSGLEPSVPAGRGRFTRDGRRCCGYCSRCATSRRGRRRAGHHKARWMTTREDEEKEIEATKAPLMDHLIELRSRLIKALAAFAIAAVVCFFFAKQIYNVLTWPYIWVAGPENSKFIYTGLLEYFIVQLKLAMFGAAFIAFPVIATQIYMFVAPGLYRNERHAFLPYLVATPIIFRDGIAGGLFRGLADAGALFAEHAAGRRPWPGDHRAVAESRRLSVADDEAHSRVRHRLPASGDPDAPWPRRHHHLGLSSSRSAAISSSSPL